MQQDSKRGSLTRDVLEDFFTDHDGVLSAIASGNCLRGSNLREGGQVGIVGERPNSRGADLSCGSWNTLRLCDVELGTPQISIHHLCSDKKVQPLITLGGHLGRVKDSRLASRLIVDMDGVRVVQRVPKRLNESLHSRNRIR